MNFTDRFIKYTSFETTSSETSNTYPTTKKQLALGKYLVTELKSIGVDSVYLDDYGIVYAHLKKNVNSGKKIGFIAHMDTSPEASGKEVKPRIIKNYNLEPIILNKTATLDPKVFPDLKRNVNHDIIVTDGQTLLGADDKAGIAIIVSFLEELINDKLKHNDIYVAFTPDEEVGKGTDKFDLEKFPADFAYTVDGGESEYIAYENFNAKSCLVNIKGRSVHPGSAKDKMINASRIAIEFDSLLSEKDRPEYTSGKEGFNHLTNISGTCDKASMHYILRNHSKEKLAKQVKQFVNASEFLNNKYVDDTVTLEFKHSYSNMYELLKDHPDVINLAKTAIQNVIGKCQSEAIRGGTDGAMLTYKGLPCPNLGTGGYNYHGIYEYLDINEAQSMIKVLLEINNLNIK